MLWVAMWLLLALGACLTFFLLGRRLWRQLKALTGELRDASAALSAVSDRLAVFERRDLPEDGATGDCPPGDVGSHRQRLKRSAHVQLQGLGDRDRRRPPAA